MSAAREPTFNDDGTLRRKYQLEEQEESKAGLRAAIGLAIASGFVLLKNVLIGQDAAAAPTMAASKHEPPATVGEDEAGLAEHAMIEADEGSATEESESESVGSGSASDLFFPKEPFVLEQNEPIELKMTFSKLPPPRNDNEKLYGAAPGVGIDLDGNGSHGPGGGGAGAPSGGGNGQNPGPDDGADDDDDDQNTGNQPPRGNRLPVIAAPVMLADLISNQSVIIALSDLLRNAHDPDGDPLIVRNLRSSSGTLAARSDGNWLFTPAVNDTSEVVFTYEISDGIGVVEQKAYLDLVPSEMSHIVGTLGNDTIIGTPHDDLIEGLAGDDLILGREGSDVIHGGDGNDRIIAGDGDDVIYAGAGDDVVFAGKGRDVVFGGAGHDRLFGEDGDDRLFGEDGDDAIFGGFGNDVLSGGSGDDHLYGNDGDDVVDGGSGDDEIDGGSGDDIIAAGAGDDFIVGGSGDDIVAGNEGDDQFVAGVGDGNDEYDGGEGRDTYDASAGSSNAVIDLMAGTASSSEIGTDTLSGIENAIGGSGNDTLVANEDPNLLTGGDGDDVFVFRTAKGAGKGNSRDKILDFEVGDRIDLDDISEEFADQFEDTFKDQGIRRFVLIGQQDAFSEPGQLRFKYDTINDQPVTIVQGNIDYDADVEFEIELAGHHVLKAADFYGAA